MKLSKSILIALIVSLPTIIRANDSTVTSSFQFNGGIGYHHIMYNVNSNHSTGFVGGNAQFTYQYHITPSWYVSVGLQYATYRSDINLGTCSFTNKCIDKENENYILYTDIKNFRESIFNQQIEIPLMFGYEHAIATGITMTYSLGLKYGVPLALRYSTRAEKIDMRAYFPQYNIEFDDVTSQGWDEGEMQKSNGTFILKPSIMAAAEVGIYLSNYIAKHDIYVGIYADYGINNIATGSKENIFEAGRNYKGIMNSGLINQINSVSIGAKVGIRLNKYTKKRSQKDNDTYYVTPQITRSRDTIKIVDTIIIKNSVIIKDTLTSSTENTEKRYETLIETDNKTNTVTGDYNELIKISQEYTSNTDIKPITIYFKRDEYALNYNDKQIKNLIFYMKKNKKTCFIIMGFTDSIGNNKTNLKMANMRINGVAHYIKDIIPTENYLKLLPDNIYTKGISGELRSVRILPFDIKNYNQIRERIKKLTPNTK